MRARAAVVLGVLALAGCGSQASKPVPTACFGAPAPIVAALRHAPGPVTLAGGTRLSDCVALARSDSDLQGLGLSLTPVADQLRARAPSDPAAALQLGYLAGAVHRGAAATSGLSAQLASRIEQEAVPDPGAGAAARAALARGGRLGRAGG
ncbi:MAG TPA: hypothetical protein VHZ31_03010 [Solirubrobacteraceae bacterium]|nr:hypothetical protein [Solirubrobacteraceae bacterium]